ncbi:TBC1 domain family member 15 isoform X1 [Prunus yedoensis var. nudiflora]|uniref:TBC1 domain family member 15 isoform X1 n=1 Tax=Prunus yedoensis var. nudiflora TaxID=2094558 RepID=A0A314UPW2_PRUYE|nr:TBC1 domain family member 15 isoform X1 [Prunus yedoensis var. nudiflora]
MALFFMRKASTAELDVFYPIRPECQVDVPKTRFRLRAGKTLSARRWNAAFSEDGHLDIAKVLRRIQRGGVHPEIKGVVWEFLLGCFDPNSTFDDRNQLRQHRREQYSRLKSECQKMVPVIGSGKFLTTPIITDDGQPIEESANGNISNNGGDANHATLDKKVIQWKLFLHQIGLDVVRTDRSLVFYESQANQAKLWDILSVYAWVDNDIGYVQGMNDICSPMVILIDNEADAFWCFERAMRRLRENFRCSASSIGVQSQLSTLSQVIKTIDPKLHQHLEDLDGGEYLFAFRMLMVLFRREFSFVDSLYLWELMWAMEYNPNIFSSYEVPSGGATPSNVNDKELKQYGKFERNIVKTGYTEKHGALSVFLVASVLETKQKQLLKEATGLDDVVKILGDITGNLDAKKACNEALRIHKKYLKTVKQ